MAGSQLKVHVVSRMSWKPLDDLAGFIADDVTRMVQPESGNGAAPPKLMGLAFTDPDGESHVYVLDEAGKQQLLKQLTGGLVVPT